MIDYFALALSHGLLLLALWRLLTRADLDAEPASQPADARLSETAGESPRTHGRIGQGGRHRPAG